MTAVEWLIDQLEKHHVHHNLKDTVVFVQAKEMEKQQIIDAWKDGYGGDEHSEIEYYNETYGSKGSDETKGGELTTFNTSSQTEISDEEIEEEWINYQKQFLEKFMKDTMIAGYAITNKETFAKWYREQLKKK